MKYMGSLSGYGTLTWVGSGSCAVQYDIEGFYQTSGDRIKACGHVSGLEDAVRDMADRADVKLALNDGRILEVSVLPGKGGPQAGVLDVEILTDLLEFTSIKPKPRPGSARRMSW